MGGSLESIGDYRSRWMLVQDRIRLTGQLSAKKLFFYSILINISQNLSFRTLFTVRSDFFYKIYFLSLSILFALTDIIIKLGMRPRKSETLNSWFDIQISYNDGNGYLLDEMLGLEGRLPRFMAIAGSVVILFVLFLFFKERDKINLFLFSLVIGGALGNTYERIFFGKVTDYLYFKPLVRIIFNFADVIICIGVIFYLFRYFLNVHKLPVNNDKEKYE